MNVIHRLSIAVLLLGSLVGDLARAQADAPFSILFLGDSLTEGLGLDSGEAFPELIAARFRDEGRTDIKVINGGVSGSTSASAPVACSGFSVQNRT